MKTLTKFAGVLMLACLTAFGQTSLNSSTLSAAQSLTANVLLVTSATGLAAPGPNNSNLVLIVVDNEVEQVVSVSSTTITVVRGTQGTSRQAHASGATFYAGADRLFSRTSPGESSSCTRSSWVAVPMIVIGQAAKELNARRYDCVGVAPAGQVMRTDAPGKPILGATVASATTLASTPGTMFVVSGTTAVATIPVPAGLGVGMCIQINPTGIFATTTAGNIGLISSATVVGRILFMCWDGSKWWPSYVS